MSLKSRVKKTALDKENQLEETLRAQVARADSLLPKPDEAMELALMLQAGVEPRQALGYFFDSSSEADIAYAHWLPHRRLQEAFTKLNKGEWQKLSPEERIELALNKHYAEMAYFLWTHHFAELAGKELDKADVCRDVLEKKLAGTAGQTPLQRFWDDFVKQTKELKARPKSTDELLGEVMDGPPDPQ